MAITYKEVEYNFAGYDEQTYNKRQTFRETDEGISSVQFRSESLNFNNSSGPISHTTSGSHYNFVQGLLFDSSSFIDYPKLFKNKLHSSGSVIYIPQQYYGEEIKPKTFKLIDKHSSEEINIIDDGLGNLYSTNAVNSRSAASSLSSSDNYIGNIQYQMGIVTITETGSWSGSGAESNDIMYTDVSTDDFIIKFNATHPIYTNQIVAKIDKNEFNLSTNPTLFSGSKTHTLISNISSSLGHWAPYATNIAFYGKAPVNNYTNPTTIDIPLFPGENNVTWKGTGIDNLNDVYVPDYIYRITKLIQGVEVIAYRENVIGDPGSTEQWQGEIDILQYNGDYKIHSGAPNLINWVVEVPTDSITEFQGPQSPLLVANFPKPVKIDNKSDLTIIIRYDT